MMLQSRWRWISGWLAMTALAIFVPPVSAADPAIVVSLKSIEELLADATYIGETVNQPDAGEAAQALIDQFTQGKGLAGVDQTQPLGAFVVITEQGQPLPPVVFIPVSDQKAFLGLLGQFFPEVDVTDDGLVTLKNPQFPPLAGKFEEGYFFASQLAPALEDLPVPADFVDPDADIAVELVISQVPDPLKQAFLQQVEAGARAAGERPADPVEAAGFDLGQKLAFGALKSFVTDGERLSLTLDIDSEAGTFAVNLGASAQADTAMAAAIESYRKSTSSFAELLPADSLMTFTFSTPLAEELQASLATIFEEGSKQADEELENDPSLKTDAEKQIAKDVKNQLMAVLIDTVKSGRLDLALAVGGTSKDDMSVLALQRIVGGQKIKGLLAKYGDELQKSAPDAEALKLNIATVGTASIHEIRVPDSSDNPIKGPVHIGLGDDFLLASSGGESLETATALAKKLTAKAPARPRRGAEKRAPISLRMKMSSAMAISGEVPDDVVAEALETYKDGGDEMALEITADDGLIQLHLEIEEGVLTLGSSLAPGAKAAE